MIISITSLRLKSRWGFFRLSWWGLKIGMQARKSAGFIKMKNTGSGYWHFTISAWESIAAPKEFAHSRAHLQAIKAQSEIASEVRIYSFENPQWISWDLAKTLVQEKGRVLKS